MMNRCDLVQLIALALLLSGLTATQVTRADDESGFKPRPTGEISANIKSCVARGNGRCDIARRKIYLLKRIVIPRVVIGLPAG